MRSLHLVFFSSGSPAGLQTAEKIDVQFTKKQSETMTCMEDLKSQVDFLQKELTKARIENKLLKRDLHLHTVVLEFYQDQQNTIIKDWLKHPDALSLFTIWVHLTQQKAES